MKKYDATNESKTRAIYSSSYTLLTTLVRERDKQIIDYNRNIRNLYWSKLKLERKSHVLISHF
jgi:hypothetical protein